MALWDSVPPSLHRRSEGAKQLPRVARPQRPAARQRAARTVLRASRRRLPDTHSAAIYCYCCLGLLRASPVGQDRLAIGKHWVGVQSCLGVFYQLNPPANITRHILQKTMNNLKQSQNLFFFIHCNVFYLWGRIMQGSSWCTIPIRWHDNLLVLQYFSSLVLLFVF